MLLCWAPYFLFLAVPFEVIHCDFVLYKQKIILCHPVSKIKTDKFQHFQWSSLNFKCIIQYKLHKQAELSQLKAWNYYCWSLPSHLQYRSFSPPPSPATVLLLSGQISAIQYWVSVTIIILIHTKLSRYKAQNCCWLGKYLSIDFKEWHLSKWSICGM